MIRRLLWRNLWRNSKRSLITAGSITFAVLLSVVVHSMKTGVFDHLIRNLVGSYTGYVQIHQKGYWEEQILDNCMAQDTLAAWVSGRTDMEVAVPRLESFMLASGKDHTRGCLMVGTGIAQEEVLSGLSHHLVKGKAPHAEPASVALGEGLANKLKLEVGDTLVLFGQGYQGVLAAGKYPVSGILHFGSPAMNENFVYLPISAAQELLGAYGMLSSLAIIHKEGITPEQLSKNLGAVLGSTYEVMHWKEMMPEIEHHIQAEAMGYHIFTGVLYLIIAFGFFGTVLMMTAERRSEFSMLLAIGMQRSRLGRLLFMEAMLLSFMGTLSGIVISFPLVLWYHIHPFQLTGEMAAAYERFGFDPVIPASVDPSIFITQAIVVFTMAFLIGLYPLWNVRKVSPLIHAT